MTQRSETKRDRAADKATRSRRRPFYRVTLGAIAASLWLLALAAPALAGPPTHARVEARDIAGFNHACGTATDSQGNVYVASAGDGEVVVFDQGHAELTSIPNANEPCGLAVDTNGVLYVSEKGAGNVVRYTPNAFPFTGTPTYSAAEPIDSGGNAEGIAVDPSDSRLFVAEGDHVAVYEADGSFGLNVGEGDLGDAKGVAAYTSDGTRYLFVADSEDDEVKVFSGGNLANLKLRKTISGVDHDANPATAEQELGFGPDGSAIAVDWTNGHFLVFDADHSVVDEFEATGQYLDQFTGTGLTDAEPTGLAVFPDTAQGPGQVYVSSGTGAGAKLLAFGPLVTPSRPLLPALSQVLAGAKGVATDPYGDVYVASGPKVHVFGPDGAKLTEISDPGLPYDLAVDSECNVYVLDGNPQNFGQMTYYDAAACPPSPSTTFTRHEPSVVPSSDGLKGIAVNPDDDHVFLFSNAFPAPIVEFDSAEEGSGQVRKCGGSLSGLGNKIDLAVYGGEGGSGGRVYVTLNPFRLVGIDCGPTEGSEEIVMETNGASCPSGKLGANPAIAVDQTNGHVLEFESGQPGDNAREYDASGACVAEFGSFSSNSGAPVYNVAVDSGAHSSNIGNVYVAYDANNNTIQPYDVTAFGPLSYGEAPSAVTGIASGIGPNAATLNGTVDPRGFELEGCEFEYLTDEEYETNGKTFAGATSVGCAETPAQIGKGSEPVAVHADVVGVTPQATRYRFRLVVENKFGSSEGEAGLFGPPLLTTKPALPILYDEATLRAEVDTSGLPTSYHFDYGIEEGLYNQSTPTVTLEPGDGFVEVKAPLTGLKEEATYHFQIVVENEAGTVKGPEAPDQSFTTLQRSQVGSCPNTEFRTGLSAKLPECRAYELVTPADTRGTKPSAAIPPSAGSIFNNWLVTPRGPGAGESVGYFAGTLPVSEGSGEPGGYRATRPPGEHPDGGWRNEFYGPSYAQLGGGTGNNQEGVSVDQRYWLWASRAEIFPALLPVGQYLRVPKGTASTECNTNPSTFQSEFELVGCGSLGTDPKAESRFVSAGAEHITFFSKAHLEDDAAPAGTMAIYDRKAGEASAEVVSVKPDGSAFAAGENAKYIGASEDGSTILFEVGATLYAHRGGDTVEVITGDHTFAGVSGDGTRVFYSNDTFTLALPNPANLFSCDIDLGLCSGPPIAEDSIFVNVAPDGSSALFTSEEALTGGEENDNGEAATANELNLYVWDGLSTRFVAILAPEDFDEFGGRESINLIAWTKSVNAGPDIGRANSPTRSTPDGAAFLFQSYAQLSAYDNEGKGQVYRFEPGAPAGERLLCISCDPSSAPAGGDAMLQIYAGDAGGTTVETTLIPNVTDDGQAAFFNSPDRLLPEDANDVSDVYQWRAKGAGEGSEECKRPTGCLALISSGQGEEQSTLYGMSADGHDVFFSTSEKLVGQDIASGYSIYDARVGGGIPDPPAKAPCQGDACQGQGSAPPALTGPASTAGVPNGNVVEPTASKCTKGKRKVKSKGKSRCVKPKKHKKAHKKKSNHKGKNHKANSNRGASR